MNNLKLARLTKLLAVVWLIALNDQCLCAPNTTTNYPIKKQISSVSGSGGRVLLQPKTASGLTVVYVPYELYRVIGVSWFDLQRALQIFQAKKNLHPYGLNSYATTDETPSQTETLLGLLDTKGIPIKSSDGDAEVLITKQSWNKSFIIDQYGAVMEILDQNSLPVDVKPEYNLKYKWLYKLTPSELQRLHDLMVQIFPQSFPYVTPHTVGEKPNKTH